MKIDAESEATELLHMLAGSPGTTCDDLVQNIFKNTAIQDPAQGQLSSQMFNHFSNSFLPKLSTAGCCFRNSMKKVERTLTSNVPNTPEMQHLEATPRGVVQVKAWERLAALCERSEDFLGVVDAEASLCEVPDVPLRRMSNCGGACPDHAPEGPKLPSPDHSSIAERSSKQFLALFLG